VRTGEKGIEWAAFKSHRVETNDNLRDKCDQYSSEKMGSVNQESGKRALGRTYRHLRLQGMRKKMNLHGGEGVERQIACSSEVETDIHSFEKKGGEGSCRYSIELEETKGG